MDCPYLLCRCEALPAVLHPDVGPPAQEGHGGVEAGSEGGIKMLRGLENLS